MPKILFLDDDATRHRAFDQMLIGTGHDVHHVWSAEQAKRALDKHSPFDIVFLDHDLEDKHYKDLRNPAHERTGRDVVTHIVAMPPELRPKRCVVHSFNPDGARAMWVALRQAGIAAERQVFSATGTRI